MSIRVMTLVWERSRHSGTDLLMLLALADFSDDQGNSYPAVPTLAAKCRMSQRNAGYILKGLQASGELEVRANEGPRGTNRYRIVVNALAGVQPIAGEGMKPTAGVGLKPAAGMKPGSPLQPTSDTPAIQRRSPLQPTADEPSLNRQEPSSKARRVRSAVSKSASPDLPDWIPPDTWNDFVEMRKSIKKPMTHAAVRLMVKKLDKLRTEGHEARAVLEQSIASCWQGLFPVKADDPRRPALHAQEPFEGAL
jgi:hypothetical protein